MTLEELGCRFVSTPCGAVPGSHSGNCETDIGVEQSDSGMGQFVLCGDNDGDQ